MAAATDHRSEAGPFDIIGDIHGCLDEVRDLLRLLGAEVFAGDARAPAGRRVVFVGDYVDRGPDSAGVLRLVMNMAARGAALPLPGNHDERLRGALLGQEVRMKGGLPETLVQFGNEPADFRAQVAAFLGSLPSHYVFDQGRLIAAHAGLTEALQGEDGPAVRDFALNGVTDDEGDADGLPLRLHWARDYRGEALVVYGHTPVAEPMRLNRTINIDTACTYGGRLTAYRYPEDEFVSVPARRTYSDRKHPWKPSV